MTPGGTVEAVSYSLSVSFGFGRHSCHPGHQLNVRGFASLPATLAPR